MIFSESVGSGASLSAIKGVNQAIARFTPFLFLIIGLKVVVQTCIYKIENAKVLKIFKEKFTLYFDFTRFIVSFATKNIQFFDT